MKVFRVTSLVRMRLNGVDLANQPPIEMSTLRFGLTCFSFMILSYKGLTQCNKNQ